MSKDEKKLVYSQDAWGLLRFADSTPLVIDIKTDTSVKNDELYRIDIKTDDPLPSYTAEAQDIDNDFEQPAPSFIPSQSDFDVDDDFDDEDDSPSLLDAFRQFENQSTKENLTARDIIEMQRANPPKTPKSKSPKKDKKEDKETKIASYAAAEDAVAEYLMENFVMGMHHSAAYIKLGDVFCLLDEESTGTIILNNVPKKFRRTISSSNFRAVAYRLRLMLKSKGLRLEVPKSKVLFENGTFDVLTKDEVEVEDNELFLVKIKANYRPHDAIPTPAFDDFIESTCRGNKQLRKRLLEFMAYMLIPGAPAKAFFVLGTASNSGKSLIADFFKELLGSKNICAIPISDFNSRFSAAQLCNKAASFAMECDREALSSVAARKIKACTGHDDVNFEVKMGPEWPHRNIAKIVFGTNHPIRTKHQDLPFYERMVVVPFLYSTPIHLRDQDLLEKLLAERDGIMLKLMKVLKRLLINEFQFSPCLAAEQMRAEWSDCPDFSVREFVKRACIFDADAKCASNVLEAAFNQFCDEHDLPKAPSAKAFISVFYNYYGLKAGRWTNAYNQQVRGPLGIALKPKFQIDNMEVFNYD